MLDRYQLPTDTDVSIIEEKEAKAVTMVSSLLNGEDAKCSIDKEYKVTQDHLMDEFISYWSKSELPSLLIKLSKGVELGANSNRLEKLLKCTAEDLVDTELGL